MNPYDIIKRPVITEKGTMLQEKGAKYLFQVERGANKFQIKRAIEMVFGVKVEKVNTVLMRGKWRRVRFSRGKTSDWKKAVVTLKEGEKIELV